MHPAALLGPAGARAFDPHGTSCPGVAANDGPKLGVDAGGERLARADCKRAEFAVGGTNHNAIERLVPVDGTDFARRRGTHLQGCRFTCHS